MFRWTIIISHVVSGHIIQPVSLPALPKVCGKLRTPMCATEYEQALMYMRSSPESPQFTIVSILAAIGLSEDSETRKCVYKQIYKLYRGIYLSGFALEGLLRINQLGVPGTTMSMSQFRQYYDELGLKEDSFRTTRCEVHRWYLNLLQPNFGKSVEELGLVRVDPIGITRELFAVSKVFVDEVIDNELTSLHTDCRSRKRLRTLSGEPEEDPSFVEMLDFLLDEDWVIVEEPPNAHTVRIPDARIPMTVNLSSYPVALPFSQQETELVLKHVENSILTRRTMAGNPLHPLLKYLMDRLFIPATEFQKIMTMLNPAHSGNSGGRLKFSSTHLNWFMEHVAPLAGSHINMSRYFQVIIVQTSGVEQKMITLSAYRIGAWMDAFRATLKTDLVAPIKNN